MTNYFERRFNKLKTLLEIDETENTISNLQNHIGLNEYDPKKGVFSISIEKISGKHAVHLNIKYTSNSFDLKKHNIKELPYEINCLIYEFYELVEREEAYVSARLEATQIF